MGENEHAYVYLIRRQMFSTRWTETEVELP